jgi:hypothetical protein
VSFSGSCHRRRACGHFPDAGAPGRELVALADGLGRVGFVKWFADAIGARMGGSSPFAAMIALVLVFYLTHYLFASVTAHVTAYPPSCQRSAWRYRA